LTQGRKGTKGKRKRKKKKIEEQNVRTNEKDVNCYENTAVLNPLIAIAYNGVNTRTPSK